jgi:D-threo-aldose 1-dehydrogenase
VRRALSLGINVIDTAPLYGYGKSEIRIGRAVQGRNRNEFVLATKVGRLLVPKDEGGDTSQDANWGTASPLRPKFDFSYDAVMRSVEESLKRLQTIESIFCTFTIPQSLRTGFARRFPLDRLRSQEQFER